MSYPPDPGGNFASDAHRRTLGHLPLPSEDPTPVLALAVRIGGSDVTEHTTDEEKLTEILKDLEADGHATQSKGGWKQTKAGLGVLSGPIATELETA